MNPLVEIRPGACLFVLGPQLTRNSSSRLSYSSVLKAALAHLRESSPDREGRKTEREISKMGAVQAMQEAVALLRTKGIYQQWLQDTFSSNEPSCPSVSDSVCWLLKLQQMGAMMACTDYDTLLDDLCGRRPATVACDDPAFGAWLACSGCTRRIACKSNEVRSVETGEEKEMEMNEQVSRSTKLSKEVGFLHLHGVQSALDSVCLFPYVEMEQRNKDLSRADRNSNSYVSNDSLAALRDVFHTKLVFLVGFDGDHQDPLLPSLLQLLYPERDAKVLKNPPILLTTSPNSGSLLGLPVKILQLGILSVDRLRDIVVPGSSKNFSVGKLSDQTLGLSVSSIYSSLLFNQKEFGG